MDLKKSIIFKKHVEGFTLIELVIIIAIVAILAAIAIPAFSNLLPEYALRSSAMQLYSDIYYAKMKAIKDNSLCKIEFLPGSSDSYRILDNDGSVIKTVSVSSSESSHPICFGPGNASKPATTSGGSIPADGVSYTGNMAIFNQMGFGKAGYVYLSNKKGTAYAIGTWASGVVILKKWNEQKGEWVR